MNIFTSYRNHARLEHQLRRNYTDDAVQAYMDSAHSHIQLRIALRIISAHAIGLLALAVAAYNVYRIVIGDGDLISIIELTFPLLALAYSWTLHRANKDLYARFTKETIERVDNAKALNELMDRERH